MVDARIHLGPHILATFDQVPAGQYELVSYALPNAASGTEKGPGTLTVDFDLMVKAGYSVYVEGVMTRTDGTDGQSCTPGMPKDCTPAEQIAFRLGYSAGTAYEQCAGFNVIDDETTTVNLHMSAETWFVPGFGPGPYKEAQSRAQWIADADLDHDGETTLEELQAITASDLFDAGYDLTSAPIKIVTAYDFAEAQARNLGRNSDGYCETSRPL